MMITQTSQRAITFFRKLLLRHTGNAVGICPIFTGSTGWWEAMSANVSIGGDETLINSFLDTMQDDECGL